MKRKLFIAISLILVIAVLGGMQYLAWQAPKADDDLYEQLNDKRRENAFLIKKVWALEDNLLKVEADKRREIKRLEFQKRDAEKTAWVLEDKLDNLKRAMDAFERLYNKKIDDIQDKYEQEIYDQALEIIELKKEVGELKEELGRSLIGGWLFEELEDFENMNEFVQFLSDTNTAEIMRDEPNTFDCDDFTFLLMRNAAQRGKRIFPCLIFKYDGNKIGNLHLMNFALVKNTNEQGETMVHIVVIESEMLQWYYFGILDKPESWRTKWYPFLP